MRKFGPDLHVCDCEWANKGNTCKHVLKIIDILKRKTTNEHDHVVGKCHLKFRFSTYIHMNVYYCFPMLTKLFFFSKLQKLLLHWLMIITKLERVRVMELMSLVIMIRYLYLNIQLFYSSQQIN